MDIIGDNSDPKSAIGLDECLMRYTRIEHLGSGGMIRCNYCDRNQESTKQLKFKVLPVILCLHLKVSFFCSPSFIQIDLRVYKYIYTSLSRSALSILQITRKLITRSAFLKDWTYPLLHPIIMMKRKRMLQ